MITNLQMELFEALISTEHPPSEDICMNLSSTGLTRALLGSCLSIAMLRIAMEVNTQYGICDGDTCDDSDDDDDAD